MAIDDFPRGTYTARIVEFPGRRRLTDVNTNESTVYDVDLAEGTVTQDGTAWTPTTMNNLENRIANSVSQIKTEFTTKQNTLNAGSNITLTPEQDGTVTISSSGGGGGASALDDLTDVDITTPTDGQSLIYDSANSKWINGAGGSGSSTLAGLSDTTITNPQADQVLKYNGSKWVNGEDASGDVELSKTVSGSVCSFSDGADGLPVKDLVAQVVAVQSGTGDPSPSNVRTISGWSAVNVTKTRKNIIKYPYYSQDGTYAALSVTTGTDGKITTSGTTTGTFKFSLASGIKLFAGTYTLSVKGNHTGVRLYVRNVGASTTIDSILTGSADAQTTFTINSDVDNVDIYYNAGTGTAVDISSYVQLELGSTATSYEPYNATTVNIALEQTVYGGSRNITSGELAITHGKITLNDLTIYRTTSYTNPVFYANLAGRMLSSTFGMADKLKYIGIKDSTQVFSGDSVDYDFAFNSRNEQIYIRADSYSDVAQFKEALGSTEIIYELATPVTVQQTGVEITAHETTNIWADTGDTTVTYYTSSASDVVDLVQYDTTKQDKLTAGTGISIDSSNVISATGGAGGAVIDDTTTSTTSVWSSSKTNSEIGATAAQILVPEFSPSKSYRADDLCIHDGKFYRATALTIPAGSWDATKWDEQTLHDVLEFYREAAVAWADIEDLGNVQVDNLANGQVLKYNSTSQRWENANESGGGAQELNDLSDVSAASPTNGQVLTYQIAASVGRWVASSVPTPWFELTGTVPAAQDPTSPDTVSVVLRDNRITANSTVDVYTSVRGKNYTSLLISAGMISISYVAGQSSFEVKARVS